MERLEPSILTEDHFALAKAIERGIEDFKCRSRMLEGDARLMLAILCPVEHESLARMRANLRQHESMRKAPPKPDKVARDLQIAALLGNGMTYNGIVASVGCSKRDISRVKRSMRCSATEKVL